MAKLNWRYGAMSAGKSVTLLTVAHNYDRLGLRTRLFTAALDHRYGEGAIASRIGLQREAEVFTPETVFDLNLVGDGIACVLVDEAQFLTREQVRQLHRLSAADDVAVICYGLRSDFRGEPFEGSAALGVLADSIEELKTLCARCGKKASMNVRVDASGERVREGEQVQIGGDESYRPYCPRCFYQTA